MTRKKLQIFTNGKHVEGLLWQRYRYTPNGNIATACQVEVDTEIDDGPDVYAFVPKGDFVLMTDRGDVFTMSAVQFNEVHEKL